MKKLNQQKLMLNLSFITSFYFVLAIYMVAFFVNRKSTLFLIACIASEYIGRFTLFSWALTYEYGVFMHLIWSIIYCCCLMFYWLSIGRIDKKIKLTIIFSVTLIFFQLIMALDCKWSEGNATFLYSSYKYIIIIIHCCIVSTFIKRGNFISFMDEHLVAFRCFIGVNGYFMLCRYNNGKHKTKTSVKK